MLRASIIAVSALVGCASPHVHTDGELVPLDAVPMPVMAAARALSRGEAIKTVTLQHELHDQELYHIQYSSGRAETLRARTEVSGQHLP